ncbi:MAG: MEDS domain-containing protein [Acidimicrobiia bacterium]
MPKSPDPESEMPVMELGIPGIQLSRGDHVCAFWRGTAELDALLLPWVVEGLEAGDRCFCVVDDGPEGLQDALSGRTLLDLEQCVADGQLEIRRAVDVYLEGGAFSASRVDAWLRSLLGELTGGQTRPVRSAGVMRWIEEYPPGIDELYAYERGLNRLLPSYDFIGICFYDLAHVTGDLVMRVLETHPKVLMGGMLFDNPYYSAPQGEAEG